MIKNIITQFFLFTLICLPLISRISTQPDFSSSSIPENYKIIKIPQPIVKISTRPSRTPQMTSGNPIQITHRISIPLNEENYHQNFPQWRSQVLEILGGLHLQHYLDDTILHGERWKQDQDHIICYWLLSSLPRTIVCELNNKPCATAYQLWYCLCMMHTINYFPTVRQLKLSLQMIKKDNATCTEYLQQFNFIANQLRRMGAFISDRELMNYILLGLGQEFQIFASNGILYLLSQLPVNMTFFQELLLQEERRLAFQRKEEERRLAFLAGQGQYAPPSYSQAATYYSQPVRLGNAGPSQYAPLSLSLSRSRPVNSYSQPGPNQPYSNFSQTAAYYSQPVKLANAGPRQFPPHSLSLTLSLSQPANSYSQPGPNQPSTSYSNFSQTAAYYSQPVRLANAGPSQFPPHSLSLSLSLSQPANSYSQRPSQPPTSYSNFSQTAAYYSQPVRLANAGPSQFPPHSLSLSLSLSQPANSYSQPGPSQPPTSYSNFSQTTTSHSQLNSNSNSQRRAIGEFLAQRFDPTYGAGSSNPPARHDT